jgi:hypothetical protein
MLRRDVRVGAMILRAAQPYLPVDVHMPVEDPSVGGDRRWRWPPPTAALSSARQTDCSHHRRPRPEASSRRPRSDARHSASKLRPLILGLAVAALAMRPPPAQRSLSSAAIRAPSHHSSDSTTPTPKALPGCARAPSSPRTSSRPQPTADGNTDSYAVYTQTQLHHNSVSTVIPAPPTTRRPTTSTA